ncbi:MAG: hypothetical protein NUV75_13285 [Gallionella sp.]|nr:hypothetical protein [Gallionella sp.]
MLDEPGGAATTLCKYLFNLASFWKTNTAQQHHALVDARSLLFAWKSANGGCVGAVRQFKKFKTLVGYLKGLDIAEYRVSL